MSRPSGLTAIKSIKAAQVKGLRLQFISIAMPDASTFEFWLDVAVNGHTACTIFGRITMPVRPLAGERITFHQDKGSALMFEAEWPAVGWRPCHIVSVEVDEVSHYAARAEEGLRWVSVVRAVPVNVRTAADALVVRDILTKQMGFELDPYGVNTLDGSPSGQ